MTPRTHNPLLRLWRPVASPARPRLGHVTEANAPSREPAAANRTKMAQERNPFGLKPVYLLLDGD
jgi:hypothetical protein